MTPSERNLVEKRIATARKIIKLYKDDIDYLMKEFEEEHVKGIIEDHQKEIENQERFIRAWTVALNINTKMA